MVGLAAAATLGVEVLLTDLPEIVPNLARNIEENAHLGPRMEARVLDWKNIPDPMPREQEKFELVLVADPLYSSEHPKLLVGMMEIWVRKTKEARAVVELPLRDGYKSERADFRARMLGAGFVVEEEGTETGWDDWGTKDGEVECWWSVWKWAET